MKNPVLRFIVVATATFLLLSLGVNIDNYLTSTIETLDAFEPNEAPKSAGKKE